MNPQDFDHPDLTAYALGELAPADADRVRELLARSPAAAAELHRIEQTLDVLREAPALPRRALHPNQRETVMALAQTPGQQPKNAIPFLAFRRSAGASHAGPSRVAWGVRLAQFAAAACLVLGAFILGQKTASRISPVIVDRNSPKPERMTEATPVKLPEPPVEVKPANVAAAPGSQSVAKPSVAAPMPVAPAPAPQGPAVASAPVKPAPVIPIELKAPAQPPASPALLTNTKPVAPPIAAPPSPSPLKGFAVTSTSPEALLTLQPKLIRPLPVPSEFAGVVLSSPLPLNAKPEANQPRKPESQPALVIHSWKAEIASCPWDPTRRLMRFVAQIPVDQPGVENFDQDYKLVARFDPFQVQAFRLVTEKHMPPTGGSTQATRFAWYEIIPARNFAANADKPVTIGSITIEQPRGAVAPDSTPLKLVDRGISWSEAREDFAFETAMIGWTLLLQGTENTSGLNYKLVLDIAEKTRGEDTKDQRARFINVVKQAQRAVGL